MEKKQTAVKWLANEILKLEGIQTIAIPDDLFHIASQMEREQIEEAVSYGQNNHSVSVSADLKIAEQYYTQTLEP
jgi:hypothetical protein